MIRSVRSAGGCWTCARAGAHVLQSTLPNVQVHRRLAQEAANLVSQEDAPNGGGTSKVSTPSLLKRPQRTSRMHSGGNESATFLAPHTPEGSGTHECRLDQPRTALRSQENNMRLSAGVEDVSLPDERVGLRGEGGALSLRGETSAAVASAKRRPHSAAPAFLRYATTWYVAVEQLTSCWCFCSAARVACRQTAAESSLPQRTRPTTAGTVRGHSAAPPFGNDFFAGDNGRPENGLLAMSQNGVDQCKDSRQAERGLLMDRLARIDDLLGQAQPAQVRVAEKGACVDAAAGDAVLYQVRCSFHCALAPFLPRNSRSDHPSGRAECPERRPGWKMAGDFAWHIRGASTRRGLRGSSYRSTPRGSLCRMPALRRCP